MAAYVHDPDAKLDYYIDWTAWLAGDTITISTWVSSDVLVLLTSPAIVGGHTQVWAEGGTAGTVVALTNQITTAAGRKENRTIFLVLREK